MAPSASLPRHQTPPTDQVPRDGVQAARAIMQEPNRITRLSVSATGNALINLGQLRQMRSRAKETMRALQSELQELEALDDDQATIKDTLTVEIKKLERDLDHERFQNKMRSRVAKETSDGFARKVKQLEQQLVEAKAKIAVNDEAGDKLADAYLEITGLEQELKGEKARCSANCDAKKELDELKAKLVEMVAGAKVKNDQNEQ